MDPSVRREREVDRLLADVVGWARSRDDVHAVVLVGSYARGQSTPSSDVDVVVLERRFVLGSGLVVELGLVSPAWVRLPLDAGTRRVLGDGHRILHDPHGALLRAGESVGG